MLKEKVKVCAICCIIIGLLEDDAEAGVEDRPEREEVEGG